MAGSRRSLPSEWGFAAFVSLVSRIDRPTKLSGISALDTPRRLTPESVAPPPGPRVSSLSDVLFCSSKSGVKDGAVSPNFSAAALHCALEKSAPPLASRFAVLDPSLQQSG